MLGEEDGVEMEDHIPPFPSNSHKSTLKPANLREGLKDSQGTQLRSV